VWAFVRVANVWVGTCEGWTLYRHLVREMDQFHMRKIADIKWRHRLLNTKVLRLCGVQVIETFLLRVRYVAGLIGHVIRTPNDRILKQVFYGQLAPCQRLPGGPTKRHKASLRRTSRSLTSSRRFCVRSDWIVTHGAPNAKKPLLSSKQVVLRLRRWSVQLTSKLHYQASMLPSVSK